MRPLFNIFYCVQRHKVGIPFLQNVTDLDGSCFGPGWVFLLGWCKEKVVWVELPSWHVENTVDIWSLLRTISTIWKTALRLYLGRKLLLR